MCLEKVDAVSVTKAMPQEGVGWKLYHVRQESFQGRYREDKVLLDAWMLWREPIQECIWHRDSMYQSPLWTENYPHGFHVYTELSKVLDYMKFHYRHFPWELLTLLKVKYRGLLASGSEGGVCDAQCIVAEQIYVPTPAWMPREVPNAVCQTENA